MTNTYCVIMAGGIGSRFWPISKNSKPKQFLDILGTGKTLLQQTVHRFLPICPIENFIIVTSVEHQHWVLEQLPEINKSQILSEPFRRNTAPCIAYATKCIKTKNANANIIVAPSDHLIIDEATFIQNITTGLEFVSTNNSLLTLGIKPHRPETGYGYIQMGLENEAGIFNLRKVKTFTEKPNIEMAKVFFESGEFYWNSGIFIWNLKSIESAFEEYLPEVMDLFNSIETKFGTAEEAKAIEDVYQDCKNISIDYGVMEKAKNVFVLATNFGWSDLGTWSSLHELSDKDENENAAVLKNAVFFDTKNTIVNIPADKVAVVKGLDDYIVALSDKALMICPKSNEQEIKKYTNDVVIEFGEQFS